MAVSRAAEALVVPPAPPVPPAVADVSDIDRNRNRIEDLIEDKVAQAQAVRANPNANQAELAQAQAVLDERTSVVVDFAQPITQQDLDQFVALGGQVMWIYKRVAYGWNGTIARSKIPDAANALQARLNVILESKRVVAHLHLGTRTGRVRQQWALGYDGDPSITIGILDTGISGGHTDLAGRQQFWHDYTTDAAQTPRDVIEHGSHVTGIALGNGVASGANPATLTFSDANFFPTVVGNVFLSPIELPTPNGGGGAATFRWDATAHWGDTGSGREAGLSFGLLQTVDDPATTGSDIGLWNVLANDVTSTTSPFSANSVADYPGGIGSPFVQHFGNPLPGGFNLNSALFQNFMFKVSGAGWEDAGNNPLRRYSVVTTLTAQNGHNFGSGDAFNLESGIAPACRWAGFKVFTDAGDGTSAIIGAAVDDLASVAAANSIMVANMSLGLIQGGQDTTLRTKVNNAVNAGVFVAVSAGNDGPATTPAPHYPMADPARAGMVMTVAAANFKNQLTEYTTFGFTAGSTAAGEDTIKPDILAPGGSFFYGMVTSIDSNDADASDGTFADRQANDYALKSGTSMASPFVAGCAALVIDAWQQSGHTWTFGNSGDPRFVKMLLCATASESGQAREVDPFAGGAAVNSPAVGRATTPKDAAEGYGMINVDAAIECLRRPAFVKGPVIESLGGDRFTKRASGFNVNLTAGVAKTFNLIVPAGADFDIYLYSPTPDARGNPVRLASATVASTAGNTETFTFTATASGVHYVVAKRVSGAGAFNLNSPNIAPTLTTISTLPGATEDTPFTITYATLAAAANEADADGDPLSFRIEAVSSGTLTKNGTPVTPGSTLLGSGEQLVWTPALNANGSAVNAFTVRAHDGTAASATAVQVAVGVTAVNDAPTLTTVNNLTGATEDTAFTISYTTLAGAANEADVDNATILFRVEAVSAGTLTKGGTPVTPGVTTLASGESLVWTPPLNLNGIANVFTVKAFDGALASATAVQVTATVTAVNDAPTLTSVNTLPGATEDTAFSIPYANLAAAADEADVEGSTISFRVEAVSSGSLRKNGVLVTPGSTLLGPGETWVWTPAANANGSAVNAFTVRARDGALVSATPVQVTVAVAAVNDVPTLTTISTLTGATEDTAFSITYAALAGAANEADVDNDPICFRVEAVSTGTLTEGGVAVVPGSSTLCAGETWVWTPAANANGTGLNAFTVKAHDGVAASATAVQVKVTVGAVNDAPTLATVNTLGTATEDTAFTITYATLQAAADEADVEGSAISFRIMAVSSGTLTKSGVPVVPGTTLLSSAQSLVWTPALNSFGSPVPAFTVKAYDGALDSATAVQVNVTVNPVNDPPTLTSVSTLPGALTAEPFIIDYATLAGAANEADVDGDVLSFRVEAVSSGTLTKNGTPVTPGTTRLFPGESFVWTSAAGASGSAIPVFTTRAHDGTVASATAVQVTAQVNNRPTITDITDKTTPEDTPLVVSFTVGDVETPVGSLTVSSVSSNPSLVPDANIVNGGSGANRNITITPLPDQFGSATITVTVTDGNGATRNDSFVLTVNPIADGSLDLSFDPGTGASGPVGAHIVQPDGKIIIGGAFTIINGQPHSYIARLNSDGSVDGSFNPTLNNYPNAFALQSDGKILVAGGFTQRLIRLNPIDGSIDTTFPDIPQGTATGVAIQADGEIVAVGYDSFNFNVGWVRRFNPNGTLETVGATPDYIVHTVAIQNDGKIVIGGEFASVNDGTPHNQERLARLTSDLHFDTTFTPVVAGSSVKDITVQPNGDILFCGEFSIPHNFVARVHANGTLDTSFAPTAELDGDGVFSLAYRSDGKVYIAGAFGYGPRGFIARLNADGTLDTNFDPGFVSNWVNTVGQQPDGKVIIGGYFQSVGGVSRNRIARLLE